MLISRLFLATAQLHKSMSRIIFYCFLCLLPIVSLGYGMPRQSWGQINSSLGWLGLVTLVFCNILILLAVVLFTRGRWAHRLVWLPVLALAVSFVGYAIANGTAPGPAVFIAMSHTNLGELKEVLPGLLRGYAAVFILFIGLAAWVWWMPSANGRDYHKLRVATMLFAILLSDFFLLSWSQWPQVFARLVPAGAENMVFPGNVLFNAYTAAQNDVYDFLSDEQRSFRFNAKSTSPTAQTLRVVLVLGESSAAQRWQLGGYERVTNPNLAQMKQGKLVYFSDVFASSTATRTAIPMIITRATPEKFDPANQERSVISAFAETGFQTAWISNQNRFPYSEEAASEVYLNPAWYENTKRYDVDLLPFAFRQIQQHKKLLLVLHTMGSHIDYRYRVPESARYFSKAPDASLLDYYDDSIRYTDYLLHQIISELEKQAEEPALIFYVSDHGQDLALAKIGQPSQGQQRFAATMAHIPALVWFNDSYLKAWPDVVDKLDAVRDCHHQQTQMFGTMLKLGHIELKVHSPSLADTDCRG
jgi:glucan phosphoethanolaminetransferase (alkaline phosphatase superfamily)